MTIGRKPDRPHVRPATGAHPRRLTDIREKSGRNAVAVGQVTGAGYLGDMQGFALPFVFVVIAGAVTVFRIFLGLPFPPPLAIIGVLSAVGALSFGVFLSYLGLRSVADVDYVNPTQFKNVSIYLHAFEAILVVFWLNWITGMFTLSGVIAGPIFLVALTAILTLRVRRSRMTHRRQLWEK